MNILITGGAGFIGSQLGNKFRRSGHNVTILDNMSYGKEDNLKVDGEWVYDTFILDDIRSERMAIHCENMDIVIHLAGIAPLPDCQLNPLAAYDNNLLGTLNVLEACRKTSVKKIIFSSTSAVYENCSNYPLKEKKLDTPPDLIYSMSKRNCELACLSYASNYNMDIVTLRFFNVYGPHQDFKRKQPPLMGYITKCLLEDQEPTFFSDGHQKRDYVYVDDVIEMIDLIISRSDISGQIFNVCTNKAHSVREIYEIYQNAFNKSLSPKFNNSTKFWDKYPQLFEGQHPLSKNRLIKEVDKYSLGSYDKAKSILGWTPKTTLEVGINKCVEYAKQTKEGQNDG
jgi:nucleoside-diphosphate-sugar epimerase